MILNDIFWMLSFIIYLNVGNLWLKLIFSLIFYHSGSKILENFVKISYKIVDLLWNPRKTLTMGRFFQKAPIRLFSKWYFFFMSDYFTFLLLHFLTFLASNKEITTQNPHFIFPHSANDKKPSNFFLKTVILICNFHFYVYFMLLG